MGHSPGLSVLSAGDNGWLSRVTHPAAAVTTAWEKRNGFQVHVCQDGASVTAQRQLGDGEG